MRSPASIRTPLDVKIDYFTFRMDVVSERAKEVASAVYEKEVGLSLRDLRLMRFIATQPGLTLTRLIEQVHLEKTLTSKSIAALIRRGLVLRMISEVDARQINLYLTKEAAALVKRADTIGRDMEAMIMRRIPEADVAVFRRCLELLYEVNKEVPEMMKNYLQQSHQDPPGQKPAKRTR